MHLSKELAARLKKALDPLESDYPLLRLLVRLTHVTRAMDTFSSANVAALNKEAASLLRGHASAGQPGRPILEGALIVQARGTYSCTYGNDAKLRELQKTADACREAYTRAEAELAAYKEKRLVRRVRDPGDPTKDRQFDVRVV